MRNQPNDSFPKLNEEMASAIIANVFAACNQEPSTVPLNVLASYTEYRRERYTLQKAILVFILLVFLLLPLCFIAPKFTVTEISRSHTGVPTYQVEVSNWLPIRLVSAKVDTHPIPVYESDTRIFTMEPTLNGRLTLTVTLANHQFDTWSADISGIDATAPALSGSSMQGKNLRIYVTDDGVGTDLANAYAIRANGTRLAPEDFSDEEGYVDFLFDQDLNFFIPDRNGNLLQLVLRIK